MKSKYETLLSVVDYVKNESENVVDELLMMGFTPCQLVNEFDFDENEVRNSPVYEEVREELMENLDESEMPFLLDNYNAFDASLMFYFEFNKDELREFKLSPLYKEMLERYDEEKDEALTEVRNEIFNDFEKRMDLENNQGMLQDKMKSAEKTCEEVNEKTMGHEKSYDMEK